MQTSYDVIVIGAGLSGGLPCAACRRGHRRRAGGGRLRAALLGWPDLHRAHGDRAGGGARAIRPMQGRPLAVLVGCRDEDDVIEHIGAVLEGRLPTRPAGMLTVTSAHDPLQVSRGAYGPLHTLRYETLAPSVHPAGTWDAHRRAYRAACWEIIGADDATRLLFAFADSPRDLERRFRTACLSALRQSAPRSEHAPAKGMYLGRSWPASRDPRDARRRPQRRARGLRGPRLIGSRPCHYR
jgi:hypothetical protein